MTSLTRWNDDRLDDLAELLKTHGQQINTLSDLRSELAGLRQKVDDVSDNTHSCVNSLERLKTDLEKRASDQAVERKADRRWMVGILLTTTGLIIAALAIFLG